MKVSLREILIQIFIVFLIFIFAIVKKKLTVVGSFFALIIGVCISLSGYEYMIVLCAFFISSVGLTSFFKNEKIKHLGKTYSKDKTRSGFQVACKGFTPTLISLLIYYKFEGTLDLFNINLTNEQKFFYGMYIGFFVSANGDTWASEIGINSTKQPFLLLKCKRVPKGINGAISLLGTIFSFLGGGFIALSALIGSYIRSKLYLKDSLINYDKWYIILFIGLFCGGLGSFIDSLLGSTIQLSIYDTEKKCIVDKEEYIKIKDKKNYKIYGYDILGNSLINLVTGIIISIISGIFYVKFI